MIFVNFVSFVAILHSSKFNERGASLFRSRYGLFETESDFAPVRKHIETFAVYARHYRAASLDAFQHAAIFHKRIRMIFIHMLDYAGLDLCKRICKLHSLVCHPIDLSESAYEAGALQPYPVKGEVMHLKEGSGRREV